MSVQFRFAVYRMKFYRFLRRMRYRIRWRLRECGCGDIRVIEDFCDKCGKCDNCCPCWYTFFDSEGGQA